jgi:hypothetical protein
VNEAFLVTSYAVWPKQWAKIESDASGLSAKESYLYKHIFVNTLIRHQARQDDLFSPVPSTLIKDKLRDSKFTNLAERGLIEIKVIDTFEGVPRTYSRKRHRCQEARATQKQLDSHLEIGNSMSDEDCMRQKKVNVFTGKTARKTKTQCFTKSGNRHPTLVLSALSALKWAVYDRASADSFLRREKDEIEVASGRYGVGSPEHTRAHYRHQIDAASLQSLLDRSPVRREDGFWEYKPAYYVGSTGRIYHLNAGLQSCTREMKQASYGSVPGLVNYDLHNSQLYGALQEFEAVEPSVKLSTTWLVDYLENNRKQEFASFVGISDQVFKRCLLARVMGAYIPHRIVGRQGSKIIEYLSEEARGDHTLLDEFLRRFREAIGPFDYDLSKWHNWLLSHVEKIKSHGRGGAYITNKCGMKLCADKLPTSKNNWEAKAKLAAFFLQGQEAAFIHHVTILGPTHGYTPIANEHDGLVVLGKIPPEAVSQAARLSGLKYPFLEPKSFVG